MLIPFSTSYHMAYQVRTVLIELAIACSFNMLFVAGVFSVEYQDSRNGRGWQGVSKYTIGALIETSDSSSDHKLLVSSGWRF